MVNVGCAGRFSLFSLRITNLQQLKVCGLFERKIYPLAEAYLNCPDMAPDLKHLFKHLSNVLNMFLSPLCVLVKIYWDCP